MNGYLKELENMSLSHKITSSQKTKLVERFYQCKTWKDVILLTGVYRDILYR